LRASFVLWQLQLMLVGAALGLGQEEREAGKQIKHSCMAAQLHGCAAASFEEVDRLEISSFRWDMHGVLFLHCTLGLGCCCLLVGLLTDPTGSDAPLLTTAIDLAHAPAVWQYSDCWPTNVLVGWACFGTHWFEWKSSPSAQGDGFFAVPVVVQKLLGLASHKAGTAWQVPSWAGHCV
jgi:hypothetical protein